MKTYSESKIELQNPQILKKKSGKVKVVVFIREAMGATKLG